MASEIAFSVNETYPRQPHEFSSSRDKLFARHRSPLFPPSRRPNPTHPSRYLATLHRVIDPELIYLHHRQADRPAKMEELIYFNSQAALKQCWRFGLRLLT